MVERNTTRNVTADVLIVGGGPTGMTLALALGRRGVSVALAEKRELGEPGTVKCNHISARTMEIFRRLGVAEDIRRAEGLPGDFPHDACTRTTVSGIELSRVPIPSRDERSESPVGPDTAWPTPEPPHRMNQIFMEPVLARHLRTLPTVTLLERVTIETVDQQHDQVTAAGTTVDGERVAVSASYGVGCEGGRSLVRKAIGSTIRGVDVVMRVQTTLIESPGVLDLFGGPPAWVTQIMNPRRTGAMIAIDGRKRWLVFNPLVEGEDDPDTVDRDAAIRTLLGVDEDFEYEVIGKEDWVGPRLVADRMHRDRLFIAGDSAHLWPPVGGNGMNAGVADAEDLAWMLGARLGGWGGAQLLSAYERERMPVVDQISRVVVDAAWRRQGIRDDVTSDIEDPGPVGQRVRSELSSTLYEAALDQYTPGGLAFGYHYDGSPIIAYDGDPAPGFGMSSFTQSTTPGCRLPHVWMPDGQSIYDVMGTDFALLRTDPAVNVDDVVAAAARVGMPLRLVELAVSAGDSPYDHKLILSRPDRHVAWRGDKLPTDPSALIDLVRGAGSAPGASDLRSTLGSSTTSKTTTHTITTTKELT
jgi:2-polyprenyl-6-methoxyphenol hydroxylase-like FAD-dependent oxidoreductase